MRACRTESPEREMEALARIHLDSAPIVKERAAAIPRGRALLRRQIRTAFEYSGAASLMFWDMPVARYTHAGDPLKIDCGYRPNGTVKLFHAVSLKGELESAKALAFSYPRIAQGIEKIEKAQSKLTAIIEDDLDRNFSAIAFALDAFAQTNIVVAAASELPVLAEVARKELRV